MGKMCNIWKRMIVERNWWTRSPGLWCSACQDGRQWPHKTGYHRDNVGVRFALRPSLFEIQGYWKSEMHQMTPEWSWALYCQKYPVFSKCWTQKPKFHSVSFYDQPFSRYNVVENWKCTGWPQNDLKHLTDNSYPLHTKYSPEAQISLRFALQPTILQMLGCWKSEMNRMTPDWPYNPLTVQSIPYTLNSHPESQISLHSALR